jgi:ribosome-associated protein
MSGDPLRVTEQIEIPADELIWRFHTTGGPGGQHANRSHTGVELAFDVGSSVAFDEAMRDKLVERLPLKAGVLVVGADEERSQWRNRQTARRRLASTIREALVEATPRVPTKPPTKARRRRVQMKRARGALKRLRRPPEVE